MQKKIPLRQCLGCREMKPKRELIRIVKSPDGDISIDPVGKKPGRGAYLCNSETCFKRIVKSKALSRVFKAPISDEILQFLSAQMEDPNGS
jgi:predicted RNA-binding protein YlxR (DUF448 family)